MTKTLLICDCLGTQSIDADAISQATGLPCSRLYHSLCDEQIDQATQAIADGDIMIACQQEAARFADLAMQIEAEVPCFVDIRDRAGWSSDDMIAGPKMAALVADAALAAQSPKTIDITSQGQCLVLGPAEVALMAAEKLADLMAVTVLLKPDDDLPVTDAFDVVCGQLRQGSGSLGQFKLSIDAFQQIIPGGRGASKLSAARDGAKSTCDVILDLTGESLFPAPEKRDGYLRADPKSQTAVADAIFSASQFIGTFEKPLYVRFEQSLCAHSRAEKPACSNCLNLCPTGAISSAGDHVEIDPMICAGCGACTAACPSGAISYDAPSADHLFRRITTLAQTYRSAGGTDPILLVHDAHGSEMIRLAARYGGGLPADVIPLEIDALAGFGHAEVLAALAAGFAHVAIQLAPKTERGALVPQMALANAIAGSEGVDLLDFTDPDMLSDHLYVFPRRAALENPVLPMGTRRQIARLAAKALQPEAELIALPQDAPYGAVLVDTDACTLCLACVSLCPSGALGDNDDLPQLRFQEDACLQCGLCRNVCPEKAITLRPQLNLSDQAMAQEILNEEEPFACISCGSLFGVKSTVEKITEKLVGNHAMFANPDAARMIQMCDNCRINAQYHSENNPFAGKERPRVRTTDDYLSKRKDH